MFSLFQNATYAPEQYGFNPETITMAACPDCGIGDQPLLQPPVVPEDANTFLFWDLLHPTTRAHELIGELAAEAVLSHLEVSTLSVTDKSDVVDHSDGANTLREAIDLANRLPGTQTISFDIGRGNQTIELSAGEISITDNIDMIGRGTHKTVVDANQTGRVFHVGPGVNAAISSLTITGGFAAAGGGIFNEGNLELSRVRMVGNQARNETGLAAGGALYNASGASFQLHGSQLTGNTVTGEVAIGGAIANDGSEAYAEIVSSLVIGNIAQGREFGLGGAVANLNGGTLISQSSLFINNQAIGDLAQGGAIYNGPESFLALNHSGVLLNSAISHDGQKALGGGVYISESSYFQNILSLIFLNFSDDETDNLYYQVG